MSLNRPHPLAPHRTPEFQNGDTIEATELEKIQSVRMKNYLSAVEEDEGDLAILAEHLVPAEMRSLAQQREDSSHYGWQPINKTKASYYNEWQLMSTEDQLNYILVEEGSVCSIANSNIEFAIWSRCF